MADWQPIETLIDGFVILTDGKEVLPAQSWASLGDEPAGDLTAWTYDGYADVPFTPTHWMPLPAPPKSGPTSERAEPSPSAG